MDGFATVPLGWKLVVTAVVVILNGFFVAAEFALVKVRPMRIQALADAGDRRAKIISMVMANLDQRKLCIRIIRIRSIQRQRSRMRFHSPLT